MCSIDIEELRKPKRKIDYSSRSYRQAISAYEKRKAREEEIKPEKPKLDKIKQIICRYSGYTWDNIIKIGGRKGDISVIKQRISYFGAIYTKLTKSELEQEIYGTTSRIVYHNIATVKNDIETNLKYANEIKELDIKIRENLKNLYIFANKISVI